jgi:WD40 repeat protein
MKDQSRYLSLCLLIVTLSPPALTQSSCPAIAIPTPAPGANIFNAQQEAALGDAMDAGIRQTMQVLQDPSLLQPLNAIATRLEAQMPANHPQIRVVLFESPSADAFSIPGHIYLSRKLIAITRSEDEMAGILSHEMGHLLAHHSAITATDNFRRVLNVTQVGDNADVVAKWNDFLNNYRRVKLNGTDVARAQKVENQHQEQADSIVLSLVAKAGYSTQAFVDVFDRIAETKGKTGNAWSDIFGDTSPDSKRLRQMAKDRPTLPPDCVAAHGDTAANYTAWRAKVIEHASEAPTVKVSGLISRRQLTERLHPQIGFIRISPDGRYLLAQDDSNIFVLTRSPLKALFHLYGPNANPAQFTPDSSGIVFHIAETGTSPRVERWDISTHKRLDAFEVYVRRGCLVSGLSPDGRTLSCLTFTGVENGVNFDFDLFDTASGNSFFHKKDWVYVNSLHFDYFTLWRMNVGLATGNQSIYDELSHTTFSPDGHYLVAHSHDNTLAMDLNNRQPINLPGNVKALLDYSHFTFLDGNRFMGVAGNQGEKSAVVEFPSGRAIYSNIMIGGASISQVAHGDSVLLRPIKDNPLGVVDLKQNKIVLQSKRSAFDVWDSQGIGERENGDLIVLDLVTAKIQESVALPDAQLGVVRAAAVSPDLKWLAISQSSRGAVWNVETGERVYHVRGFHGAYFTPNGAVVVDFPKYLKTERSIVEMSLAQESIQPRYTLDEKERTLQDGRFLLTLVPAETNASPNRNVTFEMRDVKSHEMLWSKHFAQERPGYFVDSDTNSLLLYWQAGSKEIQSLVKQDSEAQAKLAPFNSREGINYVVVLDLDSGKQRFAVAVDTGKNSIRVADMVASADRLVVADSNNRLLVYGINGSQLGTLMGSRPEVSRAANLLTARTQTGELTLYDLRTLQPRATHTFDSRVAYSAFSADGKRLLVLSANQAIYLLDTTAHN